MRERVDAIMGGGEAGDDGGPPRRLRGLTVATFHSLCARLLRRYADRAGLPGLKPDYTIYDTADQTAAMKKTLTRLDLSTTNWPPRSVLSAISNAKNDLLDADAVRGQARATSIRSSSRRSTRPTSRRCGRPGRSTSTTCCC